MSLQSFLAILRTRRWIAIGTFLVVLITAMVLTFALPKRYTASGKIVIDIRSNDPVAGLMFNGQLPPSYIGTQVDILNSERVARKVIQQLKLGDNPNLREQWQTATDGQGEFDSWLADLLRVNLAVKQSRESNALEVSYQANDPRFASALTNAFMKAYIDTSIEMRVDPARQYASLFDAQGKALREKLEAAQAKLSAFQRDNQLIATDERLDIESARLSELSTQLVMVQAATIESSSREAQTGTQVDKLQEVLGNPVIAGMKAEIDRGEARIKELQARFGDAHPQVIEARANTNELRSRMEAEVRRVSASVGVNNNVNKSREAQIKASLEAQRQRVLQLKQTRDQALMLARDVDTAQRAYDTLAAKFSQSTLEAQANQTNISILEQASPPIKASFPKVFINLALALVLGSVLGCASAIGVEMTDSRLRTEHDVIGLPLLAIIPDVKASAQPALAGPLPLLLENTSNKLIRNS